MIHVPPSGLILPSLAFDRKPTSDWSRWIRARKAEGWYASRLRKIAHYIDMLVRQWNPERILENSWIVRALESYAQTITPWAESVAEKMVAEVAARDRKAWFQTSAEMGRALHREIEAAPIGNVMRQRMADQVGLITSIPREAAERVHRLTLEGITQGERPGSIAKKIMEGGAVSRSRAMLIATTEVSRTQTELTKARAEYVGSTHFIWSTAGDGRVRPTHAKLNRQTFLWSEPPECDPGHHALPGSIWNCRCVALPVIGD